MLLFLRILALLTFAIAQVCLVLWLRAGADAPGALGLATGGCLSVSILAGLLSLKIGRSVGGR